MNVFRKQGHVKAITDEVMDTRTVEAVISDETRDRDGTIIPIENWQLENYGKNPVVGWMHRVWGGGFEEPNPDNAIGSGDVYMEGRQLIGRTTFETADVNILADKIFKKIAISKTIRMTSVGFIPIPNEEKKIGKWGEGPEARDGSLPTFYYGKTDLAEYSWVTIPSNPNAGARMFSPAEFFAGEERDIVEHLRDLMGLDIDYKDLSKMTMQDFSRVVSGRAVYDGGQLVDQDGAVIDSRRGELSSLNEGTSPLAALGRSDDTPTRKATEHKDEFVPDRGKLNRSNYLKLKK